MSIAIEELQETKRTSLRLIWEQEIAPRFGSAGNPLAPIPVPTQNAATPSTGPLAASVSVSLQTAKFQVIRGDYEF
jgi:hypothetical protein